MARHDGTGRSKGPGRYVALFHWMMRTAAWRDLDCVARCAYLELSAQYRGPGTNNGRIGFSVRQMAEALGSSKATALRALNRLQDHGFIALTKQGGFNMKERHATEWRLTEFPCDVTGGLPTKDFARWPEIQNTGVEMKPDRCRDETIRVSR